ncbi:HipA domain-containing protein [Ramlibacter sp.]|uniref:HipA domain-containing protein n=1 Tax=Ramlibacter sp. TaxID=1917967 RepID=UPI003D0E4219
MTSEVWVWCWLPGDVQPTLAGRFEHVRQQGKFGERVAADRQELFRRMVFNCCISNTDDHDRNHGFVAGDFPRGYVLSPAYDMVPRRHGTVRHEHALAIGREGFIATRRNILSDCARFGLARDEAEAILEEVQAEVSRGWVGALRRHGAGDDDVEHWRPCFVPLPQHYDGAAEPRRRSPRKRTPPGLPGKVRP